MKLVVITAEESWPEEGELLNALLKQGVDRLHIRKKDETESFVEELVQNLNENSNRLRIHHHRNLAQKLNIPYHLSEGENWEQDAWSMSCHLDNSPNLQMLSEMINNVQSIFLSPVLPSISKPGYGSNLLDSEHSVLPELIGKIRGWGFNGEIIALGGLQPSNLATIKALGFDGAALMGALWQSSNPLEAFKEIQEVARG